MTDSSAKIEVPANTAEAISATENSRSKLDEQIVATCELLAAYGALPLSLIELVRSRQTLSAQIVEHVKKAALLGGVDLEAPANHGDWKLSDDKRSLTKTDARPS